MGSILGGGGGSGVSKEAINEAAKRAEDAYFRPYTVTTSAGTASYDPTLGFTSSLSQPYQEILGTALGGAGSLFQQAAAFDPSQRASDIFAEQSALLQPQFQQQATQLQNRLFGSGRLGLRLAGEGAGLGMDSGMVQPDALGLGRAQQQTLAQLAAGSREQALNEQAQLQQLATGMLGAGQGISGLESGMLGLGGDLETARAAAAYGAGNLAISPYTAAQQAAAGRASNRASMLGSLGAAAITKFSDVRLKDNVEFAGSLPNDIDVYTWTWNDKAKELGIDSSPEYGVLAHEIKDRFPEAVSVNENGYYMVDYSHPALKGAQ